MQTLESIRRRIDSAEELRSIVKAMKAIAAVNIRQYEKAVESLADYKRTIELGLQVVLMGGIQERPRVGPAENGRVAALIFGSQQGLSGQFNNQIASFAKGAMAGLAAVDQDVLVMAIGDRLFPELEEHGLRAEKKYSLPSSVSGISPAVRQVFVEIDRWRVSRDIGEIVLFYNRPVSGVSYKSVMVHLFPLDPGLFRRWEKVGWSSRSLPTYSMERERLLSSLIRQHLLVTLYRAFAESLAAENASRLFAMQSAEKNIEERLGEFSAEYQQRRQDSITSEMLDIVGGFEALETGRLKLQDSRQNRTL